LTCITIKVSDLKNPYIQPYKHLFCNIYLFPPYTPPWRDERAKFSFVLTYTIPFDHSDMTDKTPHLVIIHP